MANESPIPKSRYIVLPARAPSIFALQIHTCKRTTMRSLQTLCNAINHCKYHSPSNTPHQSNTHSSVNPRINKYYCVPKCHQQIITGTAALLLLELYRACSPIRSIYPKIHENTYNNQHSGIDKHYRRSLRQSFAQSQCLYDLTGMCAHDNRYPSTPIVRFDNELGDDANTHPRPFPPTFCTRMKSSDFAQCWWIYPYVRCVHNLITYSNALQIDCTPLCMMEELKIEFKNLFRVNRCLWSRRGIL